MATKIMPQSCKLKLLTGNIVAVVKIYPEEILKALILISFKNNQP